ncbi:MAG: Cof-type HAD-IIB family hydrolase [Anaerolineales bacterium]
MLDYEPLSFIGEAITAGFNRPPMLEKKPGCPDFFVWRGDTYQVQKMLAEWSDYARRGRSARNMQPAHAAVAAQRGSWGVGRYYFHVLAAGPEGPGSGPRVFEIYYDRAPKGSDYRKGQWFLVSELAERSPHAVPETSVLHALLTGRGAPPAPIRLAALDLDNTLVGPDLTLSPRVKAAVARALARGVAVTIATGRGPAVTARYAAELKLTAPLICFQGGLVYDYLEKRVLHETRLDPAVIPVVVALAEAHGWNLQFETPGMIYLPRVSQHSEELLALLRFADWKRVDNLSTDMPETPHKFILTADTPAERDALAAALRARLGEAGVRLDVVPSHPILVEGLPPGLSKATGLAWLAQSLGIERQAVLAVGDNDNDVPMLEWAGVGVAMGHSSPAARAVADWIAPDVAGGGAAVALEKYVLS